MSGTRFELPQTDLDIWLENLGFSRGNPFGTVEADRERVFLPQFFVNVDGYDRIKGDRTVIAFAPRGAGKSALRVMLSALAAPMVSEATTLAIEFVDFAALVSKYRNGQALTIDDYVPELLRAGLRVLLEYLCGEPMSWFREDEGSSIVGNPMLRVVLLSAPGKARLVSMLRHYQPDLLSAPSLYEFFQHLEPTFSPAWSEYSELTSRRRLVDLIDRSSLSKNPVARFFGEMNDFPDVPIDVASTPIEKMSSFTQVVSAAGLKRVEFLVDRLDEHQETADDPQTQANILEPLLTDLPFLEMPKVAFKFFLSEEARDILVGRPKIRRDRLTDQAVMITWNRKQLKHLLNERLAVYSGGKVHDVLQLCQETRMEVGRRRDSCLVGEWIEKEMLQLAQGSPRRLIKAGQLLCDVHLKRIGPSGLIESEDWKTAKVELMNVMPSLLRIRRDSRVAAVGDRKIGLSQLEHGILLTLVSATGRCDRNTLAEQAWGDKKGVVSDATIDQAIGRLRSKLGDDSMSPTFLLTDRSKGFRLANYELV